MGADPLPLKMEAITSSPRRKIEGAGVEFGAVYLAASTAAESHTLVLVVSSRVHVIWGGHLR